MASAVENRKKTISMLLLDGAVCGRIKCSIGNRQGVAYRIPRSLLGETSDFEHLPQTGIYFLLGSDKRTGKSTIYIGRSESRKSDKGILGQIEKHETDRFADKWQHAIVITTVNDSLGSTEINYLSNKFYTLAKESSYYTLLNRKESNIDIVREEQRVLLDEFIEDIEMMVGMLGYKLFEPYDCMPESIYSATKSEVQYFYITRNDANAKAVGANKEFILLAGSRISSTTTPSCPEDIKKRRFKAMHIDKTVDEHFNVLKNIHFGSPSGAARFVYGGSANGRTLWRTAEGKTFEEVQNEA